MTLPRSSSSLQLPFSLLLLLLLLFLSAAVDGCHDLRHCEREGCPCPEGKASPPEKAKNKGTNVRWKVIIAASSPCVGFFLACVCLAEWLQHRKRRQRDSTPTRALRSTPSFVDDPESPIHPHRTHLFSYEELREATDGFAAFNELGHGGFGTVYKGKLRDGRVVAVKRLYRNNYKRVELFVNEVSILSLLRHNNLVTFYGCTSRHDRELLLVYEFVSNGTVASHLHGPRAGERALAWPVRLNIAVDTAAALAYLHAVDPQVIHRDVKSSNILLDDAFRAKVADFGLSWWSSPSDDASQLSTISQGTPGYVDPEYHRSHKLTDRSDVYSFGVVLAELLSSMPAVDVGRRAHEINLADTAVRKIQNGLLRELVDATLGFDTDLTATRTMESVAEVAFRCLQEEKEMRPSMDEVLQELEGVADRSKDEKRGDAGKRMATAAAADETVLQGSMQRSPDSVADTWISRSTTPNTSA